jgi:hypothetical protein
MSLLEEENGDYTAVALAVFKEQLKRQQAKSIRDLTMRAHSSRLLLLQLDRPSKTLRTSPSTQGTGAPLRIWWL